MANLTERQKVDVIVRALEAELDGDLFLRDTDHKVGRIKAIRKGFGSELGRPDAILWCSSLERLNSLRSPDFVRLIP